ncbi:MAG: redoxin domain-containing protein [Acidobacteria bacterium]|nr:redoxin domain-containing protein [Acidobacteriota bacterium]
MLAGFHTPAVAGQQNPIGARASVEGGSTRTLKVGDPAPDFELPDQSGKIVRLSDFKGKKNVVLAFYVLAFTGG